MNRTLFFALLFICNHSVVSQTYLSGISCTWDDSYAEWTIFADSEGEEIEGDLRLKWANRANWTEWTVDNLTDIRIQIKQKYPNNSELWELRSGDQIMTMQTKWRQDITEWRIKYDDKSLIWRTEHNNDLNYWYFEDSEHGILEMYTIYDNDSRDWEIQDQTTDNVFVELKIACIFISSYFSSPKQ